MSYSYREGILHAEELPLDDIARRFGTPCYVYSRAAIESAYGEFARALHGRQSLICYSVKANSNLAILALLARLGAGFDIVSGGELARVLAAGGDRGQDAFLGRGQEQSRDRARAGEAASAVSTWRSEAELARVDQVARGLGRRAPIALRVNPDIDPRTHPYISTGLRDNKFGVAHGDAEQLYQRAAGLKGIEIVGIGCHIGSLLTEAGPFVAAAARLAVLVERLEKLGIQLKHIDVGGGIGIRYRDETPEPVPAFVAGTLSALGGRRRDGGVRSRPLDRRERGRAAHARGVREAGKTSWWSTRP